MQQSGKRTGIDHQSRGRSVDGAVDVEVVALAEEERHFLQAAVLDSGRAAACIRINFQKQQLLIAVEYRLGGKKDVGAKDAVDFLFVQDARGVARTAKIDSYDRFIDKVERAETK